VDFLMNYVDSILEPGERVLFRTTLSWTLYAPAILLAAASAAVAIFGAGVPGFGLYALLVAALVALVAAISAVRAWFRRWTTEVAVTDRRIVLKRGFIRRHTVEMNMQKVESVDVDQTQLGRLFDYGTVTIRGVGSTLEALRMIDSPLELRTRITAG
jgi:membrane protein YdbS with pleckstrin-like domain